VLLKEMNYLIAVADTRGRSRWDMEKPHSRLWLLMGMGSAMVGRDSVPRTWTFCFVPEKPALEI
jgi:hypothetical protein